MTRGSVGVWDPFVRLGHWTIVCAFAVAYVTGDEFLTTHVWAGYVVGVVVALRIVWGFIGPRRARFSDFVCRPMAVVTYLADLARFRARRYLGHSPAGGAMVIALLLSVALTVVTGLMVYGAEKKAGPLAPLYATAAARSPISAQAAEERGEASSENGAGEGLEDVHELFANLTLVLACLHVLGVALASVAHRENLVAAMITGRKRAPEPGAE